MFNSLTNITKLLKTAGQIGPQIQQQKEALKEKRVQSSVLGGDIHVELNGTGVVQSIHIADTLIAQGDRKVIEEGLVEAFNLAVQKAKQLHLDAIGGVVKDLGIPGVDNIIKSLAE